VSEKNLYEILGVRPDASQAEIRAAYLKLAKQWHPDRNTGNEAEAERRFKEIAHAFEVLSNSEKRAAYDTAREQSSGFESTMDEADAFDLFISVLLDLAFELAENGADQITIYQALVDMGCPSGTAKTLAQKAHKLGGKSDAGKSSGKSAKPKAESRRGNGGGGETTNATASVPNEPDETFPAGPWSRWFARSLDLLVGATVASPLIGLLVQFMWTLPPFPSPDRIALYLLAIVPLPFIVDAIIVGVFGNSLGKALLKIKVHSKLTVDGVETLQPIYFDEAIQRNFEIWVKGYWFSIPILAAIPQFLAFLKVSDGKQVPWDMAPDFERVKQTDAENLSGKAIPEKQRFFVLRQKTRWELIVAFVVCVIAAPIAGKVGAELFVGSFPALMANEMASAPEVLAADAADDATEPATDASGANAPDLENTFANITFETNPKNGTILINGNEYSSPLTLSYPLNEYNIQSKYINIIGGYAYWNDRSASFNYPNIKVNLDENFTGSFTFNRAPSTEKFSINESIIDKNSGDYENIVKNTGESFPNSKSDADNYSEKNEKVIVDQPYNFVGSWRGLGQDEGMAWEIIINITAGSQLDQIVGESSYTNRDGFSASCKARLKLFYIQSQKIIIQEEKINPISVGCIGSPAGKNIIIQKSTNGRWYGVWSKINGSRNVTMVAYLNHYVD